MQSQIRLALTLAISPRRGDHQWLCREKSAAGEPSPALEMILRLLGERIRRNAISRFEPLNLGGRQCRAGVSPALRARQREHCVGFADLGRRDACPTFRFMGSLHLRQSDAHWDQEPTVDFLSPIGGEDQGEGARFMGRAGVKDYVSSEGEWFGYWWKERKNSE